MVLIWIFFFFLLLLLLLLLLLSSSSSSSFVAQTLNSFFQYPTFSFIAFRNKEATQVALVVMWQCTKCFEDVPVAKKDAHMRRHQEVVKYTEASGAILENRREEVHRDGEIFRHFECPYCNGPVFVVTSSLFKHLKKCPERPIAGGEEAPAAEPE